MKVALVRPRYHTHLITPPLGLGYLASALRRAGHAPSLIDGLALGLSPEDLTRRCAGHPLVGIGCMSDHVPEVSELARLLKARGHTVVIGGPHATALPGDTLARTGADFAVVGEGEVSLPALVDALEAGAPPALPGVFVLGQGMSAPRTLVGELDSLPFPDWEAMHPRRYAIAPHGAFVKRFPVAPMMSTRGCPCACSFCASPRLWEGRIRFRSPENVLDEIALLVRRFGVREIHFEDDNLTLRRSHAEAICEGLLSRGLDVCWSCPNGVRADTLDVGLLRLMRRAGCYALAFGVESGDQAILDGVGKGAKLEVVERAIALAGEAGFQTQGFFIFGLPGETAESIARTVEFARRSRLDRAQFLLLDVLPGSRLWEDLSGSFAPDWTRRSYQETTWCPPTVAPEVLAAAPSRAFRSFFLTSPRRSFALLRQIRPRQARMVLRRLLDFGILPARRAPR